MEVRYTVRATAPLEHRAHFTVELIGVASPTVDLVLPSWVPGSYVIRNYSRGFRDFAARQEPEGTPLPVAPVDKARWRIRTGGAARIRVEYTVYGHDLITEAFDFTEDHMLINAALCLPYVDGELSSPSTVTLDIPPDWTVVTELEEVGTRPPQFRAKDYDELVDSPIDAGHPVVLTVRPAGIPHRICLCGKGGNYEARALEQDIGKIVEAAIALVGESPLDRYTFFFHLTDARDGGLEHLSSTSCVFERDVFRPEESYRRFLSLPAHEYLHLYNVKRIRPKSLMPFDYTHESYTRLLWWMEGTTDYLTYLVLRRAGLLTPAQFLEQRAGVVKQYLETPGRNRISLEESSVITWVDHYLPFEETPNQSVSYYLKGDLVSMCLDLEILHRSETRSSLVDVLRLLWKEHGRTGVGVEEDGILPAAERATGLDLVSFFDRYVRGTEEVDLAAYARCAGLALAPKAKRPEERDRAEPGDLGVLVEEVDGLARVRQSFSGRPGFTAGLTPGDEIVAINREKVTYAKLEKTLERYPAGTPIELTVFRRGYLERVPLVTGTRPPAAYAFTPIEGASGLARKVYESWVGEPWAAASTSA
ncbi:MAG TPA: PDZ domain-containing protein [Thermoplasmata archaeon]|jgi:predicted metalloprotease with PDZ domain|nr:PDZ domain-containing protein [Thermoplasmata archaeon]